MTIRGAKLTFVGGKKMLGVQKASGGAKIAISGAKLMFSGDKNL